MKLCVGASSGGHMTELNALLSVNDAWHIQPTIYVATVGEVVERRGDRTEYVIGECNRKTPLSALSVFWRSLRVVWREHPDVIVTTGSLPLCLFALAGKLVGAKVVWIDSISQVDEISLSGKLIMPFANLFFVQWPELADRYQQATYAGELV